MACTLKGEYLLGGMPFVDWIDLLSVEGVAPEEPWELVAMFCLSLMGVVPAMLVQLDCLLVRLAVPAQEYCLEILQGVGGPVLWGVPLLTLHLQFQMRR